MKKDTKHKLQIKKINISSYTLGRIVVVSGIILSTLIALASISDAVIIDKYRQLVS